MDDFARVESAAHDGALGLNGYIEPTDGQLAAGRYLKGRVRLHGLLIVIENPRNSYREGVDSDGTAWRTRMAHHYGEISGTVGADGDAIDVFIGPWPESDQTHVVNQLNPATGLFDEAKVMIGFSCRADAIQGYKDSYSKDWKGMGSVVSCSIGQFKYWLKNCDTTKPFTLAGLPTNGTLIMDSIQWAGTEAAPAPMGMDMSDLLYKLRQTDPEGLILDPITMPDIEADADAELVLDALVVQYGQLQRKMQQLQRVLQQTSGSGPTVDAMSVSKPLRIRGEINVVVLFALTDGQSITVYFHSAGSSPSKVQQSDELISWRWMLNKKDVTILVAKENGQELNPRIISRRIMTVAARNSARFAKINADRDERLSSIEVLKKTAEAKVASLSTLQSEVASLAQQVADHKAQLAVKASMATSITPPARFVSGPAAPSAAEENGGVPLGETVSTMPVSTLPAEEEAVLIELGAPKYDIKDIASYGSYAAFSADDGNQDVCDHLMQVRIIEVRNALRNLGWAGEQYGKLIKEGGDGDVYTFSVDTGISASKYNITNCNFQVNVSKLGQGFSPPAGKVPNDMSKHADFIASQINVLTEGPVVQQQQHAGTQSQESGDLPLQAPAEGDAKDEVTEDEPTQSGLSSEDAKAIAKTIAQQLGGNKFAAMTGAKQFVFLPEGGLQFALPRGAKSGINLVQIILSNDEYDLRCYKKRGVTLNEVATMDGIGADGLALAFTEATGLEITLGELAKPIEAAPDAAVDPISEDSDISSGQPDTNIMKADIDPGIPAHIDGPKINLAGENDDPNAPAAPDQPPAVSPAPMVTGEPLSPAAEPEEPEPGADPAVPSMDAQLAKQQAIADSDPVKQDEGGDGSSAQRESDMAYLKSVIDNSADMMDLALAEQLTRIHDDYQGDADMMGLFNGAAEAYSAYMVEQARSALA